MKKNIKNKLTSVALSGVTLISAVPFSTAKTKNIKVQKEIVSEMPVQNTVKDAKVEKTNEYVKTTYEVEQLSKTTYTTTIQNKEQLSKTTYTTTEQNKEQLSKTTYTTTVAPETTTVTTETTPETTKIIKSVKETMEEPELYETKKVYTGIDIRQPQTLETITEPIYTEPDERTNIRYMNVQDSYAMFSHYNITSLTQEIERNLHTNLTEEERLRYDTLFEKTKEKYKECLDLYELGNIEDFNRTIDEIMTSKEYICLDDIIQMYAFAINGYEGNKIINNPKNYIIEEDSIIIDGIRINNVLPKHGYTDYTNPFTMLNYFYENSLGMSDEDTMELMNLYTVNIFLPYIIRDVRVGNNWETGEMYTYTNMGLEKVLSDSKARILNEYGVTNWDFNTVLHTYLVSDSEQNINICDNNSELYNLLENCDKIQDFNEASKIITYIGYNENKLRELFQKPYQKENNLQYTK